MAHYAQVVEGKVINVLVMSDEMAKTFKTSIPSTYIKTSYNTSGGVHYDPNTGKPSADQSKALRKNYAAIGMIYDEKLDAFYDEKPYPSWTLDEATCVWVAPVPMPVDDNAYMWNEAAQNWEILEIAQE